MHQNETNQIGHEISDISGVEYAVDNEKSWKGFWMLIFVPKRDEIYFESVGKENLKFEKKSENKAKRHQFKRNAKDVSISQKMSRYHYCRALNKNNERHPLWWF